MHFGRGHSESIKFDTKAAALNSIRTVVFNNEDCINFSCYREDIKTMSSLQEALAKAEKLLEMRNRILSRMDKNIEKLSSETIEDAFQQNRKEWAD
jgi:hypothetical protein